jgi:hypothetical protein
MRCATESQDQKSELLKRRQPKMSDHAGNVTTTTAMQAQALPRNRGRHARPHYDSWGPLGAFAEAGHPTSAQIQSSALGEVITRAAENENDGALLSAVTLHT